MSDYLTRLSESITTLHNCKAKHVSTTPVKEVFRGQTVWDGDVETFELIGHSTAKRVYAWGYPNPSDPKKLEVTTVLGVPPVTSELAAVRAAIVAQGKGKDTAGK